MLLLSLCFVCMGDTGELAQVASGNRNPSKQRQIGVSAKRWTCAKRSLLYIAFMRQPARIPIVRTHAQASIDWAVFQATEPEAMPLNNSVWGTGNTNG